MQWSEKKEKSPDTFKTDHNPSVLVLSAPDHWGSPEPSETAPVGDLEDFVINSE